MSNQTTENLAIKVLEEVLTPDQLVFIIGFAIGCLTLFLIMRFVWISGLNDRIKGLETSTTDKNSLIQHYKELSLTAPANQKYTPETTKILLNTLYQVTEISEAMTLEIPTKYNIQIYGSYEKPNIIKPQENMHILSNDNMSNFIMLSDIPTYLYFQYSGDKTKHIIAKGFIPKPL